MKMNYRLRGMSCASCAAKIEKAVGRVAGIEQAAVNFATETLTVSGEIGAGVIEDTIKDLGYEAEKNPH